jgi:hypothetical protein
LEPNGSFNEIFGQKLCSVAPRHYQSVPNLKKSLDFTLKLRMFSLKRKTNYCPETHKSFSASCSDFLYRIMNKQDNKSGNYVEKFIDTHK